MLHAHLMFLFTLQEHYLLQALAGIQLVLYFIRLVLLDSGSAKTAPCRSGCVNSHAYDSVPEINSQRKSVRGLRVVYAGFRMVYARFAQGFRKVFAGFRMVYAWFAYGLRRFAHGLRMVCARFTQGLRKVCARFTQGLRKVCAWFA